jgi:hypothetical protein
MKMEQIECSETSAYKIQTPGTHPEENIQHTEHGESLKSKSVFLLCRLPAVWYSSVFLFTLQLCSDVRYCTFRNHPTHYFFSTFRDLFRQIERDQEAGKSTPASRHAITHITLSSSPFVSLKHFWLPESFYFIKDKPSFELWVFKLFYMFLLLALYKFLEPDKSFIMLMDTADVLDGLPFRGNHHIDFLLNLCFSRESYVSLG